MTPGPARVAILGAESTGKSTLASRLAAGGVWVPEYLREFVDVHGRVPREDDQEGIARTQRAREDALAVQAHAAGQRLLFCDTAPLMTAVYSRIYWGRVPAGLLALEAEHATVGAGRPPYALTLVAAPDLPWEPDGLQRESEAVRLRVHERLLGVLDERGIPWTLVQGDLAQRVRQVQSLVASYI